MEAGDNSVTEALPSIAQAILPVPQVTCLRAARRLAPNALSFSAVGARHAVPGARTWRDHAIASGFDGTVRRKAAHGKTTPAPQN
jgi:hypothetical protein